MVTRVLRSVDAPQRVYVRGVDSNLGTRVLVRARRGRRARRRGRRDGEPCRGSLRHDRRVGRGRPRHSRQPARERHRGGRAVPRRRRGGVGFAPRDGVVGDGVRRVLEQPGPDHRGVGVAPRPRVRVRPPAGVGRGARRGVAARRRRPFGHGPATGPGDGRGRYVVARARARRRPRSPLRRGRPGRPVRAPRRRGVGRRARRSSDASTACTTSPRTAGSPASESRALTGDRLRFPLPERVREVVGALRWRFQRGPIPPGLGPYTREPWVVANDKLRSAGWTPTVTNEQTYVEGTESRWWTMVTPKRRQELSLGAMVGVIADGVDRGVQSCSAVGASPTSSSIGVKSALPPSSCWMHMPTTSPSSSTTGVPSAASTCPM